MKRKFRLTRSTDFKRVRRLGKSYAHPLVVLIVTPNQTAGVRIGVAAGRSVGGAVVRNRAKRRIRACVDGYLPKITPGWDLIFLARQPIREASYDQIQEGIDRLLKRTGLILEIGNIQ